MVWKAVLRGHDFDLQALAVLFRTGDPRVVRDGEDYHLESSSFATLSDVAQVKSAAESLLAVMNGAARTHDPSHESVELVGRFIEDEHHHSVVAADTIRLRARAGLRVVGRVVGQPGPGLPTMSDSQRFATVAQLNRNVAEALTRFASGTALDWYQLWKVWEIIREDMGGRNAIVRHGWVTDDDIDAFRASVNDPAISGDGARHARHQRSNPPRSMTKKEAQQWLAGLLRPWIDWREQNP